MSAAVQGADWQTGFLNILPVVVVHACIQFRALRAERREDAIQEAIASACVSYQLLAAGGRLHVAKPGMIADFAVRFVRNGRHVGGHQDGARDCASPAAQRRHGFQTTSIDRYDRQACEWRQMAIADGNVSIPDTVCFKIDFDRWLKTLSCRDRRIIAALLRGEGTSAVASRFGISAARVSQLRRVYERCWNAFQRRVA